MDNTQKKDPVTLEQTIGQLTQTQTLLNQYVPFSRTDLNGNITYVNTAMCTLSGYSKEELIGQSHRILCHPLQENVLYDELWQSITQGEAWEGELRSRRKDNSVFWVKVYIHLLWDQHHNHIGFQALHENITDRKELEVLATIDKLTGIYNRSKFDEYFQIEFGRVERYKDTFSLVLCDVDYFKKVNDTHGHLTGDQVLINIVNRIQQTIRFSDRLARWGVEEFVILLPHTVQKDAKIVAEKMRKDIENTPFETVGNLTISCGVSQVLKGDNPSTFFQRVDNALYMAKRKGRNCTVCN